MKYVISVKQINLVRLTGLRGLLEVCTRSQQLVLPTGPQFTSAGPGPFAQEQLQKHPALLVMWSWGPCPRGSMYPIIGYSGFV